MNDQPFRVLLVEDNAGDARLIEEMLREAKAPFTVQSRADRLAKAIDAAREDRVDLALLDLTLPDSSGLETFSRFAASAPGLPTIVLSGLDDHDTALHTVHQGAQDYLVKGRFDAELLVRAMRYALERGRAERALAHERDLFQALLTSLPDRIYFKDHKSRYIRINPAMAEFFRLKSHDEAIGRTDFDFFAPEHAQQTFEDELAIMRTGEPIVGKIEKEPLTDSRSSWALSTKMPLRDREGRIVGTVGISRDISELKEMETELAAERNLLRSVINNVPDPIYVKDADGRYVLDNSAHMRFLGKSASEEIMGKTEYDFFSGEVAQESHADDEKIMRSGFALVNHKELVTARDGTKKWLLTTKVPLRDDEQRVRGLVCIGRDITEQERAEEQLRKANADLSAALTNLKKASEDLRSMQLQLIEAEKMKSIGRLAAGVAHEVKNPLAIIGMGIDYLTQQPISSDSNVPVILQEIRDAVKRADDVIRGLLDFSALKQLHVGEEDLNAIIEKALLLVRGEFSGGRYRIIKELRPDLPKLKLDRSKIEQVFVNLFTNAAHAMPDGGALTVRTFVKQLTGVGANIADERSESFRVGDLVVVTEIEDSGSGIPEDKLAKLFEPFFTTKPTGQGTGLGLTVTRSIIHLHRGMIQIANRAEGGAKVTLMFNV